MFYYNLKKGVNMVVLCELYVCEMGIYKACVDQVYTWSWMWIMNGIRCT